MLVLAVMVHMLMCAPMVWAPHGQRASRLGVASSRWEGDAHTQHHRSLGTRLSSQQARYGVWPLQCRARAVLPQVAHACRSYVTTPALTKKFPHSTALRGRAWRRSSKASG